MVSRYMAGAANLPFFPIRSYYESRHPEGQPEDRADDARPTRTPPRSTSCRRCSPTSRSSHAQRADADGDTQIWGLLGCQKEVAFAAKRVIVVVEEIVEESTIRQDPNRTVIPGAIVDAVVRGAVRLPSVVRAGLLRPRQPVLPRRGTRSRASRLARSVARRVGLRTGDPCRLRGEVRRRALGRAAPRARDVAARSTTGGTRERLEATADGRLLEVRDHDRRERAPARGRAQLLRRGRACPTSCATSRSAPWRPSCS